MESLNQSVFNQTNEGSKYENNMDEILELLKDFKV
jgi:hypothetical protein